MLCARVAQPEDDRAHASILRECDDLAEIEIERDDDPPLGGGFGEDLAVWKPVKVLIAKMFGVVSAVRQPFRNPHIGAHVDEEARHQTV